MSGSRVRSIQHLVTRRLLIGTLTAAVGANVGVYFILRHEVQEQFDEALEARARALSTMVIARSADGPLVFSYAGRDQPQFRPRARRTDYFQIWDSRGNVVARSPSLGEANLSTPSAPRPGNHDTHIFDAPLPDGRAGYCIEVRFAPYVSAGATEAADVAALASDARPAPVQAHQSARLVVAADRAELDETLAHLAETLGLAAIALAATSVTIVVLVVRGGLRPLLRLAEDAARVDADRLAFRFDVDAMPGELQPISLRLNDLLGRLDAAFARERRFTADAAHELRTPIAELRSLSEVALRWPPESSEHADNYRNVLAAARQMEAVVDALLTLARHHGNARTLGDRTADRVSLAEVVAEAWRSHEALAVKRGLSMQLPVADEGSDAVVQADRALLLALLHNLLSNAASHAPANTLLRCSVDLEEAADACTAQLRIANDNADLTADDLPKLSLPFWRKEKSRSDASHAGLGLALVNEYAAALGVRCSFELRDRGATFVVTLCWPQAQRATTATMADAGA